VHSHTAERGEQRLSPELGSNHEETTAELLSDPHCRCAVEYLRERGEPTDVSSLAANVVARMRGIPVEEAEPDVRRRVQIWLHHGQLPALADHGVVEYDPEDGVVRLLDATVY